MHGLFFFMKYLVFILLPGMLLFQACRSSSRVLTQDLSFLYNPDSPVLKYKVMFEAEDMYLYLSLSKNEKFKAFESFRSRYQLSGHKSYTYSTGELIKLDSVPMQLQKFWDLNDQVILKYSIQPGKPDDVFFVKIDDRNRGLTHLLDLGQIYKKNSPEKVFMLTDSSSHPQITTYLYANQNYQLEASSHLGSDSISYHFYKHDFPPADPPYLVKNVQPEVKKISPDSGGVLTAGKPLNFQGEGVVILSSHKEMPGCFSYLLKSSKYPHLTSSKELIEPLAYLTSESEYKQLLNAKDHKLAIDDFWMEIGGSMEYSRKLVQHYYSRVEFANQFFTSYKEGWKTDRGMVFIIMGKPDYVTRSGLNEIWQYDQIFNKEFVTFAFRKQPIFLSNDNYELQRSENFKILWDALIDNWRKGIIIKNNNL